MNEYLIAPGNFFTEEADVTVTASPLEVTTRPCLLVSLENPLATNTGAANTTEIYYGGSSRQRRRLLPGQSTEWIPVREASQLWVRLQENPPVQILRITYSVIRPAK